MMSLRTLPLAAGALFFSIISFSLALSGCGGSERIEGLSVSAPGEMEPLFGWTDDKLKLLPLEPEIPALGVFPRDPALKARLAHDELVAIERGRGGRSLAFKVELESGGSAYFKPEQTFSAAHYYSEIAAYCVDRSFGFHRVAEVSGRAVEASKLRSAAAGDPRWDELIIQPDGTLRGAMIAWIEGELPRFDPGRGFERLLRIDDPPRVNPYQAPIDVRRSANLEPNPNAEATDPSRPLASLSPERLRELSDLIVFDYLIQNVDRWGGRFTNLRLDGADGKLIFLDNGAGFWPGEQRLPLLERRLQYLQRFRRETVAAIRETDASKVFECINEDILGEHLLSARLREGLEARVLALREYIKTLEDAYGDAIYIEDGAIETAE